MNDDKPAQDCDRCLQVHASHRCDDGVHHASALPYPQRPLPAQDQSAEPRRWQIEKNSKEGHTLIRGPDTIGVVGQLTRVRVIDEISYAALKERCEQQAAEIEHLKCITSTKEYQAKIKQQAAEIERLRKALAWVIDAEYDNQIQGASPMSDIARKALEGKE